MTWDDLAPLLNAEDARLALNDVANFRRARIGHSRAGEALSVFELRERSAREAGKRISGLPAVLAALEEIPWDENVLLFHLISPARAFTIFVRENPAHILGIVRIDEGASSILAP